MVTGPVVEKKSLLTRTARALFDVDANKPFSATYWDKLTPAQVRNYEAMAAAALTLAYRESVSSDDE